MIAPPSHQRQAAATAAVLLLVPLFLLREAVFGGCALYERDIHLLWHAQVEGFTRAAVSGALPAWDPWIGFGQPLLANPNTQVYYPPTWLNLLMSPWTYYTVYAVAHLAWAGLGMFVLASTLGMSLSGARVAAAVFMASGPVVSLVSMWNHFAGAAWMPWVVAAAVVLGRDGGARSAIFLGAALAVQFIAGSPDMSAYTGIVIAGVVVVAIVDRRHDRRAALRIVGAAAVALGLAIALAAAQWMPTLDVVRGSARWGLPDATRTYWSVHPLGAFELLWPALWRTLPMSAVGREILSESREPFLVSIYLGLPAVALVLPALLMPRRGTRLLAVIAGVAVLVALGRHTPVHEALVAAAPMLRLSRFPVKALPVAAMGWAFLCGAGWDVWRDESSPGRRTWLATAAVVAGLALAGGLLVAALPRLVPSVIDPAAPRGSPAYLIAGALAVFVAALAVLRVARPRQAALLATAVAAVAVLDLLAFHRNLNATAPSALYRHRPPVAAAMPAGARIFTRLPQDSAAAARDPSARLVRFPAGWTPTQALALAQQLSLESLTAARWGIRGSFGVDYMSLQPTYVAQLSSLLALAEGTPAYGRLLRAAGVTHVVTRDPDFTIEGSPPASEFESLLFHPVRAVAVPSPLPRLLVVGSSRAETTPFVLGDPAFDPATEVVLADGPARAAAPDFAGVVERANERADRLSADVRLSADGYFVVLDAYDPGWRATVDGRPAPIQRANHAFRAVAVPPGRHHVEMSYQPASVRQGLAVSAAGLLAIAVAAFARQRRA